MDRLEHLSDLLYLGLVSTTDALGNTTAFAYDGADNLTSVTFADGTSFAYEYDRVGNLISQTDALGNVTAFEYDALRQLVKTTYPDGSEATGSYDASGNLISTTDADGNTATAAYDAVGNLVAVTDALGNTTAYEYDKTGQLTAETLANGGKTHYNYDNMGRVTSIVTATGETTSYTYDAADNILTVTAPDGGVTEYTYDAMGRLLTETAPDGATTQYTYDLAGRLSSDTDAKGSVTAYTYDANGNLTEKQTARGTIHYAYDALNQIIAITDADGTVTNYEYDAVGNLVFREDEPEDETDVLSEPSEQGPEFYPELEANRFGQKGAVANGTVSPVFLRRSVSAGNAISIAAKSVEKSKGTLLKKKKAAPAIVTRDTAGKITKKTDTGASGTAITGKSKTVNILNRSIAAARIATAKKQTAAPQKPSASIVPLSTSRSLTASSPSVKAVTRTQASCSKQETQTSWPQRALDAVKDVLLGAGNAFGRNMINGGATIVVAAGNVPSVAFPSVAFPSVAFPSGALQFVNPSGKDIYEEGRRQWSNYINGVARDWTEGLELTTRSWATDQVRYDAGQIIGDVGTLAAEYAAFLKAAKVVSGAIKGISGMILADEAASSIAIAGAGAVAEGVTLESYLAVAAEIFLNFSAFKNDWDTLQEDWKEAEAKEAEEAVKEPEVKDGEVAVEEGGSSTSTLTIEEVEEYAFNAIEGPENADSVVLGKYEEGLPTSYDAVAIMVPLSRPLSQILS